MTNRTLSRELRLSTPEHVACPGNESKQGSVCAAKTGRNWLATRKCPETDQRAAIYCRSDANAATASTERERQRLPIGCCWPPERARQRRAPTHPAQHLAPKEAELGEIFGAQIRQLVVFPIDWNVRSSALVSKLRRRETVRSRNYLAITCAPTFGTTCNTTPLWWNAARLFHRSMFRVRRGVGRCPCATGAPADNIGRSNTFASRILQRATLLPLTAAPSP